MLREDNLVPNAPGSDSPAPLEKLVDNYFHAVEHGMLKVFAKMGNLHLGCPTRGRRFLRRWG